MTEASIARAKKGDKHVPEMRRQLAEDRKELARLQRAE
jgi:hypothetical protein